jgi:DNA-directed RNA polymerase subunit M/transcription elongation factor TFIIS
MKNIIRDYEIGDKVMFNGDELYHYEESNDPYFKLLEGLQFKELEVVKIKMINEQLAHYTCKDSKGNIIPFAFIDADLLKFPKINPSVCPYCGSEDISNIGDYEHYTDMTASVTIECNKCSKTWTESYVLSSINTIEDGKIKETSVNTQKQSQEETTVYTVIIQLVFGGVEEIYTFSKEEEANSFIVDWANNNSENEFKNAYDALEWFRLQDAEVDYTIQLFETKMKG